MGEIDILSIGRGHLTVTFTPDDPKSMENAKHMIEDMLKRGASIFVETDKGLTRVKKFNPKRMTYIIDDIGSTEPTESTGSTERSGKKAASRREIPAADAKATAVGRSAGG